MAFVIAFLAPIAAATVLVLGKDFLNYGKSLQLKPQATFNKAK